METEHSDQADAGSTARSPRKGKLTGSKPPLQPKRVWAIKLQIAGRKRDLALFNVAIDSKLRGCDVVSLRVEDVAPHGCAIDRDTIRQRKTGRPVKFELTEQTRQAIDALLAASRPAPTDYLFQGHPCGRHLTTRQYSRLLANWLSMSGLDASLFGTHSLRRTRFIRSPKSLQANTACRGPGRSRPRDRSSHERPYSRLCAS